MNVNCVIKLCENTIHFVCIFIVWRFFGQKSWKLTEHYLNFLCTWKLIFPPYLLIATCLHATFFWATLVCISISNYSSHLTKWLCLKSSKTACVYYVFSTCYIISRTWLMIYNSFIYICTPMDGIQCRGSAPPPFRICVGVLETKGWIHMKGNQNS